jgi:hypothetical protein
MIKYKTPKIILRDLNKHERPWFTYWHECDKYHFSWYKEGKEVILETSLHGVIELRDEFLANGYKWK